MLRPVLAFLGVALPLAGCGLISDFHTAGYGIADSGTSTCAAAFDCDAGEVCCVSTLSPLAATCRAAPCPNVAEVPLPVQLCQGNGECGSLECAVQTCQWSGQPISVSSCGAIPICTVTPGEPFDAGTSQVDAGTTMAPFDAGLLSLD